MAASNDSIEIPWNTTFFNEIPRNTTIFDRLKFFHDRLTGLADLRLLDQVEIIEQLTIKTKELVDAAKDIQIFNGNRTLMSTGLGLTKNATLHLWDYFQRLLKERLSREEPKCTFEKLDEFDRSFVVFFLIPAIFIFTMFSFFKTRKNVFPKVCWRRPALVYPINFHHDLTRRWATAAAFAVIAYRLVLLFFGEYYVFNTVVTEYHFPSQFALVPNVLLICTVFGPFLLCISLRKYITANVVGILYGIPWYYQIFTIIPLCLNNQNGGYMTVVTTSAVTLAIPVFLALVLLTISNIMDLVCNLRVIYDNQKGRQNKTRRIVTSPNLKYVKALFHRKTYKPEGWKEELKFAFKYEKIHGFKYSPRVICTMVVAAFAIYKVGAESRAFVDSGSKYILDVGFTVRRILIITNDTFLPQLPFVTYDPVRMLDIFLDFGNVLRVSAFVACWVSLALHALYMVHIFISYRKHVRLILRGDCSWHPPPTRNPTSMMVSSLKYPGYQIAFMIYGFLIAWAVFTCTAVFVAYAIVLPFKYLGYSHFVNFVLSFWPTAVVTVVIYILQVGLAYFFFLQNRGKYIALDNRRVYHIIAYQMFFFNVLLGIFTCLMRLIISAGISLLLIARADWCLLIRGFESLDSGHNSYLGMLYMDIYHTHPVLLAFVELLHRGKASAGKEFKVSSEPRKMEDGVGAETRENDDMNGKASGPVHKKYNRRIVNRWYKMITLANNPELIADKILQLYKDERDRRKARKGTLQENDDSNRGRDNGDYLFCNEQLDNNSDRDVVSLSHL